MDGYLFITGRTKSMIISGGINIYPEEIEQVILQIKGVKDVIVYGVSDDMLGEVVCAKVVCYKHKCNFENTIKDYCRQMLAPYKVPKIIEFVEKINKTYNGKNRR